MFMQGDAVFPFTVLVLDDEPEIILELQELLGNAGYRSVGATTPECALELFQADESIGLVILDVCLADGYGPDLLGRLRVLAGEERCFEALAISGKSGLNNLVDALRAGFADYHHKPLDPSALLDSLRRLGEALDERIRNKLRLESAQHRLDDLAASLSTLAGDAQQVIKNLRRVSEASIAEAAAPEEMSPEWLADNPLFGKLSSRQMEVVRLVGKGLSNYQIACELGISSNTVKLYVSQSLKLTGLYNRTQLAVRSSPRRKL